MRTIDYSRAVQLSSVGPPQRTLEVFMKTVCTAAIAAFLTVASVHAVHADGRASPYDRTTAVANGWIYDDFDAGVAKAKETGKPMMVVIRCPP